jgi:hypothetical protein
MFILWPCSIKWWLPHINLFSFFFKISCLFHHIYFQYVAQNWKKLLGKKEISIVKILFPTHRLLRSKLHVKTRLKIKLFSWFVLFVAAYVL